MFSPALSVWTALGRPVGVAAGALLVADESATACGELDPRGSGGNGTLKRLAQRSFAAVILNL